MTALSSLVFSLRDPAAQDSEQAGGKAGRLAALMAAGFPVPEGVVLGTRAFQQFAAEHHLGVASTQEQVRDLPIPSDVSQALAEAVKALGDIPLAVRSSGVAEDLVGASYAGQYETVLDVRGVAAVEAAVRQCWASAFGERVQAYRTQQGEAGLPPMAVLVQRLVAAEAAGVAFTANPVTGDRLETLVSAVRGLGDRLVSGSVSADEWVVRSGVAECSTNVENAVDAAQVSELSEIARRIEKHFGTPQDVEWALADGHFFVLQARPITTLPPSDAEWDISQDYGDHWLIRDLVDPGFYYVRNEQRCFPITPIYADFGIAGNVWIGTRAGSEAFGVPGGRGVWVLIDGFHYGGRPTEAEVIPASRWEAFEQIVAGHDPAEQLRKWWDVDRPKSLAMLHRIQRMELGSLSTSAVLAHIQDMDRELTGLYTRHFTHNRGVEGPIVNRFARFCQAQLDLRDLEIVELLTGASPASSDAAVRMEELAAQVVARPSLRSRLEQPDAWSDHEIRDLFGPYLEEFGYRAPEKEYCYPTLVEQPEAAAQLLREAVSRIEHHQDAAPQAAQRRTEARIAELSQQLPDDATRAEFASLLDAARAAYGPRDDTINQCMWGEGLMRQALLEAGRRLSGLGMLPDPDLVWFLRRQELEEALSGTLQADLGPRTRARQAEYRRQRVMDIPHAIGKPPARVPPPPMSEVARVIFEARGWSRDRVQIVEPAATGHELRGQGVSRGVYRGVARVVRGVEELDRVKAGEVLVCPQTSPTWTNVFARIGALVLDEGSILSHPAILARENGVPAVVGTALIGGKATDAIPDGMTVEVDGVSGIVRWD